MKNIIVKDERNYQVIAGNAISVLNSLPPSIYEVYYNPETGFSLNEIEQPLNITSKLYGEVDFITDRVLSSFERIEGNLGALFSGPKGVGKSLTVRNICQKAVKRELPVILVKKYFSNISQFIESICQSCVVVFDEFEKSYNAKGPRDKDDFEGQENLLNLFDSLLAGKKLFLLTCNDWHDLSHFLLNRPGRIHYHFKYHSLSVSEISAYCVDNLAKEKHSLISEICSSGVRIPNFSYDMLRSIVFELNNYSCSLDDVKNDLNISIRELSAFCFKVYLESGEIVDDESLVDFGSPCFSLEWNKYPGGKKYSAIMNLQEARWTGNDDGSLVVDKEFILKPGDPDEDCGDIEKIIFIPTKNHFRNRDHRYIDY
jgi:hypothetical protein